MPYTAYASPDLFRDFLRDQGGPATADSALEALALEAAARAVDRECGRTFQRATGTPTARVFQAGVSTTPPAWPFLYPRFALDVDDFFSVTGLLVKFDTSGNGSYTTTATAYRVGPVNAPSKQMPYQSILLDIGTIPPLHGDGVQVTADWGWPTPPADVALANLIQGSRFLKRRDSPYGVAGSPDLGNELRLLAKVDPDVALMLRPYKIDTGFR
jgi:hypothetical protein